MAESGNPPPSLSAHCPAILDKRFLSCFLPSNTCPSLSPCPLQMTLLLGNFRRLPSQRSSVSSASEPTPTAVSLRDPQWLRLSLSPPLPLVRCVPSPLVHSQIAVFLDHQFTLLLDNFHLLIYCNITNCNSLSSS